MFIDNAAKKLHCSISYLRKLILAKKINAILKKKKNGHKSYFITDKFEVVKPLLSPKAGYKKNGSTKINPKGSSLLTQLLEWRSIPEKKRIILINLSKYSLNELKLLQELVN